MRRSEINRLMREAEALLAAHRFALPPWARWTTEDWRSRPGQARYCARRQMGWDVTDFGSGHLAEVVEDEVLPHPLWSELDGLVA